jgi:hypothetical protein
MEVSTSYDSEVMRAKEILLNRELYESFLQKKPPIDRGAKERQNNNK